MDTKTTDTTAAPFERLAIRRVPIESLHLDPANVRKHGEENLDAIKGSLRRFGQAEPLVVHQKTGRVIGGNGRLVAMKAIGWTECDVVELDVDDITASALGIALNRTAELAEWDEPGLAKMIQELQAEGAMEGLLRVLILFGANRDFREAVESRAFWLGKASGRWVQVHTIGNPGLRDDLADRDLEFRSMILADLRADWNETASEYGGEREALHVAEFRAAEQLGLGEVDLPCMIPFLSGTSAPLRTIPLRDWRARQPDLGAAVALLERALSEERLLAFLDRKDWIEIGPGEQVELVDSIEGALVSEARDEEHLSRAPAAALEGFERAIEANPDLNGKPDKTVYAFMNEHDLVDKTFGTWSRNLRSARKAKGLQKNRPGRGIATRSIIRAEDAY